jgi:hypothetical protein
MGFFDKRKFKPPEPPERPEWFGPPNDILPGQSAQRTTLVRTDQAVLVAQRFSAYPNGFTFDLTVNLRNPDYTDHFPWELEYRPGIEELPDTFVRLGIVFSDGSSWSNLDSWEPREWDEPPEAPFVVGHGGGGGDGHWEQRYWVWPLPPEGPLTFIVSWPSEGVDETSHHLDATELRQRAEEAERLWPAP